MNISDTPIARTKAWRLKNWCGRKRNSTSQSQVYLTARENSGAPQFAVIYEYANDQVALQMLATVNIRYKDEKGRNETADRTFDYVSSPVAV